MASQASLLWHDDELIDSRKDYVAPWSSWLNRNLGKRNISIRHTSTLQQLAKALQNQSPPFDLLLIDVMLKREPEQTFASIGFGEERILRLDAGVQLVGLLRNAIHDGQRLEWLTPYRDTPIVLLSSSPILDDLIKQHVDVSRQESLWGVSKSVEVRNDEVCVDREFEMRMEEAIGSFLKNAEGIGVPRR